MPTTTTPALGWREYTSPTLGLRTYYDDGEIRGTDTLAVSIERMHGSAEARHLSGRFLVVADAHRGDERGNAIEGGLKRRLVANYVDMAQARAAADAFIREARASVFGLRADSEVA